MTWTITPPGRRHAVALGQHLVRVGDVLEHGVRADAVDGAGAKRQRGGVGDDVDRVRGSTSRRMSSARPVGVGELARALVAERGPRAELEVHGAGPFTVCCVGGAARGVPLAPGAGEQRVDAVEQMRPPGREVLVQGGHAARRPGPGALARIGLLDEVEEALDALGIGPPGHGIDTRPPLTRGIMPARRRSTPVSGREAVDGPVDRDHVEPPGGVLAERRDARDRRHRQRPALGARPARSVATRRWLLQ
jgi:hypothetical protein